ncbi:hypothetical protein PRIPAC_84463 [Pristionchus pacificus]|uniref:Uncharacterized protein n=1 Tax=Pristionchus pacificus TaxID=54126 RepID=A0A2A6BL67_PRIPA|nr:hypothetical protein PRIPAC_84463 [Pristionchus pacificus]|eukprot:PDM66660.1 hypothetical protein PRIPAC_48077 [Pristionchus pacificus]
MWRGSVPAPPALLLLLLVGLHGALGAPPVRRKNDKTPGYPVIMIPGDAGSRLLANLTGKPETVHYACSKYTTEYFDLWLDLTSFAPIKIDCWVDNMKLVFDNNTKTSSNMPGVDVQVPNFGSTTAFEWLDTSKASQGRYFVDLVEALVSWGYRRGKDVVGAPYDWRKAPNEHTFYYAQLKVLTEQMYRWNGNKKVVFVAHSMGNPTLKYFLDHVVDSDWKAKFVRSFVSIAAPWGGSMQVVKLFASGYNMNYYRILLPPSALRPMLRSFTSSALLFPNEAAWNSNEILATDKGKNKTYTTANIQEFFADIGYEIGWEQYKVAGPPLIGGFNAPDVDTHCIYGHGMETPERFDWDAGYFPDYPPSIAIGDGDGTVNRRSAEVCLNWRTEAKKKLAAAKANGSKENGVRITAHDIPGAEHMAIMKHPAMFERVRQVLYDEA